MEQMGPFLDDLASAAPVPGGGSAAAVAAAMAAALLAMVGNLTLGRKRYAAVQDRAEQARDEASRLLTRARELADEDALAYSRVSAALTLPRETDSEQTARRSAVQEALKAAAVPPLETMSIAAAIARQAAELVSFGNRSAITDVGTAAFLADSAYRSARLNVEVNLNAVHDEAWKQDFVRRVDEIPDPGDWNAAVQSEVGHVLAAE